MMPHEVIMPALGMAQDTGLIVAWHKQPGDAVSSGDILMEVETDKATMEVEAGADGYVVELRAAAGDDVPVGNIIAVISEDCDAVLEQPVDNPNSAANPAPQPPTEKIEGAEVIMPALGMAQDTGLIIAWHKQPGDLVKVDDVLLEVETDKATMEVPAGHDGYIAALLANANEAVPVGEVIAVITAEKPDKAIQQSITLTQTPDNKPATVDEPPKSQPEKIGKSIKKTTVPIASNGRILASPKARRLAREQGLDLAWLANEGHPQPYHAADLELLRTLAHRNLSNSGTGMATNRIEARLSMAGFAAFSDWLNGETGSSIENDVLWAAFAAASLRSLDTSASSIVICSEAPITRRKRFYHDPDLGGLGSIEAKDEDTIPNLILRDMGDNAITTMTFATDNAPVLNVAIQGKELMLSLESRSPDLIPESAIKLITGFTERLKEPLRLLL
jgi:biotin carboxyl carrier protein